MKFEVYRAGWFRKEWRWRFISNGRTIAVSSEGYRNYVYCLRGIELLRGSASSPVHARHCAPPRAACPTPRH
jgi:uncharacterized protein YegP (UPF0339 family)